MRLCVGAGGGGDAPVSMFVCVCVCVTHRARNHQTVNRAPGGAGVCVVGTGQPAVCVCVVRVARGAWRGRVSCLPCRPNYNTTTW